MARRAHRDRLATSSRWDGVKGVVQIGVAVLSAALARALPSSARVAMATACLLGFALGAWHAARPPIAAAQAGENAEYKQVVKEALEEFNRGNWSEASALFERAHRIMPSARTLRGMGLTAYEDRRYVDSIKHLRAALEDTRRPLTPQQTEEVTATLERARRFVSHLHLKVQPRSAEVKINGRLAEPDETGDVPTDPGMLEVEISADEYVPELRRVRVSAGARETLAISLRPVQQEAPAGGATSAAVPVPTTVPGQQPEERSGALTTAKWVVGGLALAGLITGGVMVAVQQVNAKEYDTQCKQMMMDSMQCDELFQDLNPGGLYWTAPIVAFSVGGGLAAVATVLFIVDAADSNTESARLPPCGPGPGTLGVQCRLSF